MTKFSKLSSFDQASKFTFRKDRLKSKELSKFEAFQKRQSDSQSVLAEDHLFSPTLGGGGINRITAPYKDGLHWI